LILFVLAGAGYGFMAGLTPQVFYRPVPSQESRDFIHSRGGQIQPCQMAPFASPGIHENRLPTGPAGQG
jgi:hypothetical protein